MSSQKRTQSRKEGHAPLEWGLGEKVTFEWTLEGGNSGWTSPHLYTQISPSLWKPFPKPKWDDVHGGLGRGPSTYRVLRRSSCLCFQPHPLLHFPELPKLYPPCRFSMRKLTYLVPNNPGISRGQLSPCPCPCSLSMLVQFDFRPSQSASKYIQNTLFKSDDYQMNHLYGVIPPFVQHIYGAPIVFWALC